VQHGVLFGAPIPQQYEVVGAILQNAVEMAVTESHVNGISKRGKEVTPWLLRRVEELSQGKSLESNIALIENTASIGKLTTTFRCMRIYISLGGQIAVEYSKLLQTRQSPRDVRF
jgi:pseudouridine-5'-phosphate glycosidase/pseudouridine kinase